MKKTYINIGNEESVKRYVNTIAEIQKQFGKRPFTRGQYEKIRNAYYAAKHGRDDLISLSSLRSTGMVMVVDAESFEKAFLKDRWGCREEIDSKEYAELMKVLDSLKSELGEVMKSELEDKVETIDCERFFYTLQYTNLGSYMMAEMPWMVVELKKGNF